MRFATDIVKLDSRGFSKKGIVPTESDLFYRYNELVYSPIEGTGIPITFDGKLANRNNLFRV